MTNRPGPVVTDPELLRKLNADELDESAPAVGADLEPAKPAGPVGPPITDPELLRQLNAPAAKPDTRSTLAKVDDTVARHLQNFYYGAGSSVAKGIISYGGFDQAIGGSAGAGIAKFGVKMDEWLKAKTGQLRDDHTMADQFSTAFGNMASFLIPGWGTQAIATKAAVNFPKYANIIGQLFGSGTAAVMEAAMEHGDRVQEEMANGATPAEAAIKAKEVFWYNIPAILATNQGYFTPMGKLARVLMNAPAEGIQETVQQIISNMDAGRPWQEGIKDAFLVGAGVGGAVSAMVPSEGVAPTVEQISQDRTQQDLTSAVGPPPLQAPPVKPPEIEVAPGFEEEVREKQIPAAQQTEMPLEKAIAKKKAKDITAGMGLGPLGEILGKKKSDFSPRVQKAVTADIKTRTTLKSMRQRGMRRNFRGAYEAWIDDLTFLHTAHRDALKRAGQDWFDQSENKPGETPYVLARLSRSASTQVADMLDNGILKWGTDERTTRGLPEIMKEVDDLQYFVKLMEATAVVEYAEVREGLVDEAALAEATQIRDDILESRPGWAKVVDEVGAYNNASLKWMKQAGVVEDALYDKLVDMYKRHVPLYKIALLNEQGRVSAEDLRDAKEQFGPSAGVRAGSFIGRKGKIEEGTVYVNPLEAMVNNMLYMTSAALVNDSKAALAREGDRLKDPSFVKRIAPKVKRVTLTRQELDKIVDVSELSDEEIEAIGTIWRIEKDQPEGVLAYREKGKTRYIAVDKDVWRMYKNLSRKSVNALLKWASLSTKVLRATVTMTPDFAARNWVRDVMSASILGHTIRPHDMGWAIWQVVTKGEGWQEYIASGAGQATMAGADMQVMQRKLAALQKKGKPYLVVRHGLSTVQAIASSLDSLSRLPQYKRQMKKNLKKVAAGEMTLRDARLNAAMAARWPSIDFMRRGTRGKDANLLYAFFNAAVQGMDIATRRLAQPGMSGKGKRWAKAITMITFPSVLLWAMFHDEDWYKDQPRWLKNSSWLISFDRGKTIVVIPKPFELGLFFGSLPERVLDHVYEKDPRAVESWIDSMIDVASPINVKPPFIGLMPTPLGQGILEMGTNRSAFTGRDVVPYYLSKIDPQYQYDEQTSETAKVFGEFTPFNASPKKVDQFLSTQFGTLSKLARPLLDDIIYVAAPSRKRVRPSRHLMWGVVPMEDVPVVKSFVRAGTQRGTRWTDDFYHYRGKTIEANGALDHNIKRGASDATVRKQLHEDILWIRSYDYFRRYNSVFAEGRKAMRDIELSNLMTSDEKRNAMDRIKRGINDRAKEAVEEFVGWSHGVTDEDLDKLAEDAWKKIKPALEKRRGKGKITGGQ